MKQFFSKVWKAVWPFLVKNVFIPFRKLVLFWEMNDINKEGLESVLAVIVFTFKARFLQTIVTSAVYIVMFSLLHVYGFSWQWLVATIVVTYIAYSICFLLSSVDVIYRCAYEDAEDELEKMKAKAAKAKAKKPAKK